MKFLSSPKISLILNRCRAENYGALYICRIITAWLITFDVFAVFAFIKQQCVFGIGFVGSISPLCFILSVAVAYAVLTALRYIPYVKNARTDIGALLFVSAASAVMLSAIARRENKTEPWHWLGFCLFFALAVAFTLKKYNLKIGTAVKKGWIAVIMLSAGCTFMFTGVFMAMRYYSLYCPAFDFGIFTQMFESMKNTMLPTTTVERGYLMSHFDVHFSPAYYLLLPIYMIFPHPATLQVLQGLLVTSGIIPFFLICRKYGFSEIKSAVCCMVYAFYPAITGGCCYDFHENCMLVPFLMWVFFAVEAERLVPLGIFSLLTLTVKEDAVIYIATVGLYLIFSDRKRKIRIAGIFMIIGSVLYFLFAYSNLSQEGLKLLDWHYAEFVQGDGGIFSVIIAVIINPANMIANLFGTEKLIFFLQMLVPLGLIPLVSRKFHRYLLFIPFVLINLMPNYEYQHNIFFQYVFGSGTILLWLFLMNLKEMKSDRQRAFAVFCSVAAMSAFFGTFSRMVDNVAIASLPENKATIEYLEGLPVTDKSITAQTLFVPALYKQPELYSAGQAGNNENSDIVLLDRHSGLFSEQYEYYINSHYTEVYIEGIAGQRICRLEKTVG